MTASTLKTGTLAMTGSTGNMLELDGIKSYATRKSLQAKLVEFGFDKDRYVVCCTLDGRFTAVFAASNFDGGYVGVYSDKGFLTFG